MLEILFIQTVEITLVFQSDLGSYGNIQEWFTMTKPSVVIYSTVENVCGESGHIEGASQLTDCDDAMQ